MSLIYITGPSGAGKSTIRTELMKRGYEAHDTDENDISAWYDNQTNELVERPPETERSADWYQNHEYRMSDKRVEAFVAQARDKPIFLCGMPANDINFAEYYDKIIYLAISKETMQQRVLSRTTNDFGQSTDELELMLHSYDRIVERYKKLGAVTIDASQPIDVVTGEVLANV
jgi:thymidylate kinase